MTARCTYCRTEIDVDDEDTLPVCGLCAVDPAITGDRDQVDATFVIDTISTWGAL